MSDYTDYMEDCFFSRVSSICQDLYEYKKWIDDYVSKREKYPEWVTRDGKHILVKDVDDNHLENLLNFLPESTVWHRVFECEKQYRYLSKKVKELEREDAYNQQVINLIY